MPQLILSDSKLVFLDFFNNPAKQKALKLTKMWVLYEDPCRNTLDEIEALPPSVVDLGRPLTEQLGSVDTTHDSWGLFVLALCEAYRLHPALDADIVKVLDLVRDNVIASKGEVYAAYPKEAARALDRARLLPKLQADLQKVPLAGSNAKTLFDAVQRYTDAGVQLNDLLAERGSQEASAKSRAAAVHLRNAANGLLGDARGALATEIHHSKGKLPESLDGEIFGYYELLLKAQAERDAAAERADKDKDKPAAAGEPQDPTP